VKGDRFQLTLEEKVLIHLLDYERYKDAGEVPSFITQDGMVKSVGVKQSNISYIMKYLKEKGWSEEKLTHVIGMKRRRKAYFLTSAGHLHASRIKKQLESRKVQHLIDGELTTLTLGELREHMGMDIISLIQELKDEGTKREDKRVSAIIEKLPTLRYFYGREDEMLGLKQWLKDLDSRICVISGMAGIGKTTLMIKHVNERKDELPIFWYRIHEWSTVRSCVARLSEFLSAVGCKKLKTFLTPGTPVELEEIVDFLAEDLSKKEMLLVFDDCHKAPKHIVDMFKLLLELTQGTSTAKIIFSGRTVPQFYDRSEVVVKKHVTEYGLSGLDEKATGDLLNSRGLGLSNSELKKVFKITGGHPLALELLQSPEELHERSDIMKYLNEEIVSNLRQDEKRLLGVVSIFRYPVDKDGVFLDSGASFDTIDRLVEKSILKESHGMYDLHDLLREFFYMRLNPDVKKELHLKVADYYLEADDEFSWMEAMYHLLKAEKLERAIDIAIERGEEIINKGYLEEFMTELDEIMDIEPFHEQASQLHMLMGDIFSVWSMWDEAIASYEEALKMAEERPGQLASAHMNIGKVYWRKGYSDTALLHLKDGMKHANEIKDMGVVSKIYLYLGNIYWGRGNWDRAIENYENSLELLRDLGERYWMARVYNNLGTTYYAKGERKKAIEYLERCIPLAKEIGDLRYQGYGMSNAAEVYALEGELDIASEYAVSALEVFKKLNEKAMIANTFMVFGIIAERREEWIHAEEYFKLAIDISEEVGHLDMQAQAHYNLAMLWKKRKDYGMAREHMETSLRIYSGLKNTARIKKCKAEMKGLG
jgi:tetratricopeptide (TPR) repeat protein/DNA-binding PadR family transcriptional regulator